MNRLELWIGTIVAFAFRLLAFGRTPHPMGTDGYAYVVQTETLVREGHLHMADTSWVFGLYGLVGLVLEPIWATKVVAAGIAAMMVPAAAFAGSRLTPGNNGRMLAVWAAASPTVTHLAIDFPKNLAVLPVFLVLLGLLSDGDGSKRTSWWLLGLVTLAVMSAHRTGVVLALALWVPVLLARAPWRVVGVAVLTCLVVIGWTSKGVGFDVQRIVSELHLGRPSPWPWLDLRPFPVVEVLELGLGWVMLGLGFALRPLRPIQQGLFGLLILFLLPIFDGATLDLGYRLALLTPMVAMGVWASSGVRASWWTWMLVPVSVFQIGTHPLPPYEIFERVVLSIPRPLPKLLIAHRGLDFYYHHRTGQEAMAWSPESSIDRRTVGRVVVGIRPSEWRWADVRAVRVSNRMDYVPEVEWERFLRAVDASGDDGLIERVRGPLNPSAVRPWKR